MKDIIWVCVLVLADLHTHFGADHRVQKGLCIPEGMCVIGCHWYVSQWVTHLSTTCPYFTGSSCRTRWRSRTQKHSSLNTGLQRQDMCERTCISFHTALAKGASLLPSTLMLDSHAMHTEYVLANTSQTNPFTLTSHYCFGRFTFRNNLISRSTLVQAGLRT